MDPKHRDLTADRASPNFYGRKYWSIWWKLINNIHILPNVSLTVWDFVYPAMMSSTPHLSPCWPGWWAGPATAAGAGNVSSGCSDWPAWGRGWQQSPRQRTPSSSTTWLDGWWVGGGGGSERGRGELLVGRSASYVNKFRRCHLDSFLCSLSGPGGFIAMRPECNFLSGAPRRPSLRGRRSVLKAVWDKIKWELFQFVKY